MMHSNNPAYKDNIILKLSFEFSLEAIEFCEVLHRSDKRVVANQLIRSATSIGANVREAQNAESTADFIHKLKLALKELNETEYWLLLCKEAPSYTSPTALLEKVEPIWKVLNKIVASTVKNQKLNRSTGSSKD